MMINDYDDDNDYRDRKNFLAVGENHIQELEEEGGRVPEADGGASRHMEVGNHRPSAVLLPSAINHSFTFHRKLKSALRPRIAQESFARAEAAEKLLKESKDKVSSFIFIQILLFPVLKKGRSDCDCVRSSRLSFFNRNPKRTVPSPANRSPT